MVQPPAVTIRAATPEDAHSVAQVHVDSWRHAYRGLLPDDYLDALSVEDREAMWLGAFSDPAARTGAFVAEAEGRVVGFASFGPTRDEDARNGTGEIPAIYVAPSVLGTGVGRGLLAAAIDGLREAGFGRATLWVLEANERARRFYEKAGWTWDGTVSHHQFDCANEPIVRYVVSL
jgi:GNAT superfamily N-acetyltransferase